MKKILLILLILVFIPSGVVMGRSKDRIILKKRSDPPPVSGDNGAIWIDDSGNINAIADENNTDYSGSSAGNPNISETGASVFVTPDTGSCATCFAVGDGAGGTLLVVKRGGALGIGEIDPLAKLHVTDTNSGSITTGLYLKNATGLGGGVGIDFDASTSDSVNSRIYSIRINGDSDYALVFSDGRNNALVEAMRLFNGTLGIGTADPNANTLLDVQGIGSFTGGVTVGGNAAVPSGLTAFASFASGASPTALASGFALFGWQNQGYVMNSLGEVTQITPHDPETGEIYMNSFNYWTGDGLRYYPLSGLSETYTVPKVDWAAFQSGLQKQAFLQTEIETTATFKDEDIITKTGETYTSETRYRPKSDGTIEPYQDGITTDILEKTGTKKVLNERLDSITGQIYRKRTEGEFVVDLAPIRAKWDGLPQFLKNAIVRP